jgi:hypothetical protein
MTTSRDWRAVAALAAAASCVAATPSCAVFTDLSVDGYTLADAGDASVCASEAGPGFLLGCASAGDCNGAGICCLKPMGCVLASECSTTLCTAPFGQLCQTDRECGAVPCLRQQCVIGGVPLHVSACVALPGCSADAPAADAQAPDAGGD